jgi:hypothetical protein
VRVTAKETELLWELLGCSVMHTSHDGREWVRLSAKGLVERERSFLHDHAVKLTDAGRALAIGKAREQRAVLLNRQIEHSDWRAANKTRGQCPCGYCTALRVIDREDGTPAELKPQIGAPPTPTR